jgi:hypothetical protein
MCFTKKGLPKPEGLVDINSTTITAILQSACAHAIVLLSDSVYSTCPVDELRRFLKDDDTNEYRYVSEYYDCDDFSYRLMGQIHNVEWGALPFGILWVKTAQGNHAVNIFIDEDHIMWVIEPQTDEVYLMPSSWIPYLVII